jgi:UDP-2,3-diacylglucosamine pyrophosphatase LpxH
MSRNIQFGTQRTIKQYIDTTFIESLPSGAFFITISEWELKNMDIAIISDLHIGSGDQTDRFGHDDYEFLRFLKYLEANFQKVVLLGDVFETLTGREYGKRLLELKKCFQAHPEVSRRLVGDRQKYIYIHGNHDLVAAEAFCSTGEHLLSHNGSTILFTHGHIFDRISTNARQAAEWFVWLGGHILRRGGTALYELFRKIDDRLLGADDCFKQSDFEARATRAAESMEIDAIVTGHSHTGGSLDTGKTLVLNSGACMEGRFQFISLNPTTMEYKFNCVW